MHGLPFQAPGFAGCQDYPEHGGGFTRFYRAMKPLKFGYFKRSIVVTKGLIEFTAGLRPDHVHQICPVGFVLD